MLYFCITQSKFMKRTLSRAGIIIQRGLLTLDITIQGILLGISIYLPALLITSVLIGGWQLLGSLLKGIFWNSSLHALYFAAASGYSSLLYIMVQHADWLPFHESNEVISMLWFFMLLPPLIGAIWYFGQSVRDFYLRA